MAQGAAMRNGTPMRLVSPAPVLVPPQPSRQTPAASLYSNTPQSLYGANVTNTSVNGTTLGGESFKIGLSILLDTARTQSHRLKCSVVCISVLLKITRYF